ncbi:uncharacterized protein LOC120256761 [Dioscorea cayenensis subsp. rotundata]|uniref:Uncharacterized protein LOC120256761 n=1 Tax=Dioscorea cayennensis subsp. rotundata TaxID=55577 RepID=A0AB40AZA6_DIOCR|nr:uncharacterized protein LOC120256761 [Dioscorea cayenensis subsp. rotundata]
MPSSSSSSSSNLHKISTMNFYRSEESSSCCYFHPKETVVGICALCLKERLVILASKQGHHLPLPKDTHTTHKSFRILRRKPIITFNKVFALGSFLHRLDFKQPKPDIADEIDSIPSLDGKNRFLFLFYFYFLFFYFYFLQMRQILFISIKVLKKNGRAMWDNKKGMMMMKKEKEVKSVVEHSKPRGTLRWRKRIGHLLQLARWKGPRRGPMPRRIAGKSGRKEVGLGA